MNDLRGSELTEQEICELLRDATSNEDGSYSVTLPGKIEFIEMTMSFDGPPILKG